MERDCNLLESEVLWSLQSASDHNGAQCPLLLNAFMLKLQRGAFSFDTTV